MKRILIAVAIRKALCSCPRLATIGTGGSAYEPDASVATIPGYTMVWNDEFNVDGPPDPEKWNFERGFCRNEELQWYQRDNAVCEDNFCGFTGCNNTEECVEAYDETYECV